MDQKRKKVAIIGAVSYPGGISRVVDTIINCPNIKNHYGWLIFNTSQYKDGNFFINFIVFVRALARYFHHLLKGKIDLAHIHTSYQRSFYRKIFFIFLSSFFKVKTILHFHTGRFEEYFINPSWRMKKIIEMCLAKVSAIVVLCQDWKDKIEHKYGPLNTYIIHNPISFGSEEIPVHGKKQNRNHIQMLFFGFIVKKKGIYDIIEVADRLNKEKLSFTIMICGKGEEENRFLKKIKEKNLRDIQYLGWVSGQRRIDLFAESDVFFLPSYYEGMNNSILEAIAFGLPVVTTKVGGTPEMVVDGKNGYLSEPGDIEGFVEKLKVLILNPALRSLLGQQSRVISEKFNKENIAEEWHRLYQNLFH